MSTKKKANSTRTIKGKVRADAAATPPTPHAERAAEPVPSHVFGIPVVGTVNPDGSYTPTPGAKHMRPVVVVSYRGRGPVLIAEGYGGAVDPNLLEFARWMAAKRHEDDIAEFGCGSDEAVQGGRALAELSKAIYCLSGPGGVRA